MRFLSLFSGIEAASMAWLPLGWECVGVAEIEKFPCSLLAHRYPDVPNLGDITKITKEQIEALGKIDLVVGGFPCQDLSIAGKRKGLKNDDGSHTRSGLFFDAMRVVRWANPRYLLLENVPGIYSSNCGRDFASMVGEILGVGFSVPVDGWRNTGVAASERGLFEWATLDAQWFGVPQRRRRMFALADFGDWRSRPPVLFERHSLSGNIAPSRKKGQEVAGTFTARANSGGWGQDVDLAASGYMRPVSPTLRAGGNQTGGDRPPGTDVDTCESLIVTHSLRGEGFDASEDGTGRGTPLTVVGWNGDSTTKAMVDVMPCMRAEQGGEGYGIASNMQVRRLTPRECERLQGFPDDYSLVQHNNKPAADGPRYKALGNSFAVPVVRWIGERIEMVNQIAR